MQVGRVFAIAVVAAFVVAGLPTVSAQEVGLQNPNQSTPTTLYFHINGFQDFPINTQKPDDSYKASEGVGLATHSTSCLPEAPGTPLSSKSWHTFYGYSSPGYVQYDVLENGRPRYHPERGISFDALLDSGVQPSMKWYLETQTGAPGSGGADPNTAPVVVPQVVVRATLREGDTIGIGDEHYNEGNILMQGQTAPSDLSPSAANYREVDGKHVYEFDIPLDVQIPKIPRATGYNVRVDVYMEIPGCDNPDNGYLMPNAVRVHTSPDARPRLELSIMNPIRIEYLHPQFVGDDLVVHTSMNSPWGNYDVDEGPGGIEVGITGPSPATSMAQVAFTQRHEEHNHHQEAVDVSYVWPYKQDNAKDGLYTVSVSVWNDQRTAQATGAAQFEIGKGTIFGCGEATTAASATDDCKKEVQPDGVIQEKDSPGVGLVVLLGALAALAVTLRKRN